MEQKSSQIDRIAQRFATKRSLHDYLTQRCHFALPRLKLCTMKFLHQVLQNEKEVVSNDKIQLKLPHSQIFSTEYLLKNGYVKQEVVKSCFPDNPFTVDRQFAWAVYLAKQPDDAEQYYQKALDTTLKRRRCQEEQDKIKISDQWIQTLLKHEVPYESQNIRNRSVINKNAAVMKKSDPFRKIQGKKRPLPDFSELKQNTNPPKPKKKLKLDQNLIDVKNQSN